MAIFRAALVQMRSGTDPERNGANMEAMVREAAARGADYVQTPEMTGAVQRDRKALAGMLRPQESDIIAARASSLAGELGIHLHIGSTAIALDGGMIANRAFLFGPDGALIATYDKIHMFDV
ncbi:MAG: carbon-nitrogen hydrolase family protein, partial [Notoacmeibacter sp.]|nr:carbon-nitrogen hydrolase family protein [Notoacmeibacter sp.]